MRFNDGNGERFQISGTACSPVEEAGRQSVILLLEIKIFESRADRNYAGRPEPKIAKSVAVVILPTCAYVPKTSRYEGGERKTLGVSP
jgi:hypothetical protein